MDSEKNFMIYEVIYNYHRGFLPPKLKKFAQFDSTTKKNIYGLNLSNLPSSIKNKNCWYESNHLLFEKFESGDFKVIFEENIDNEFFIRNTKIADDLVIGDTNVFFLNNDSKDDYKDVFFISRLVKEKPKFNEFSIIKLYFNELVSSYFFVVRVELINNFFHIVLLEIDYEKREFLDDPLVFYQSHKVKQYFSELTENSKDENFFNNLEIICDKFDLESLL